MFFFFKQKTAYEMRISDWSSDVCSSDLRFDFEGELAVVIGKAGRRIPAARALEHVAGYTCMAENSVRDFQRHSAQVTPGKNFARKIGRASCRERVCQYV